MKAKLLIYLFLFPLVASAQTGGNFAFPFLDLTYNGRSAGLSGNFITGLDNDINMGVANPSLLNEKMVHGLSVNQSILSGGVHYGMFNYGFNLKDIGTMSTYVKFVNYGKFDRTSITGENEGTFSPFEMIAGTGIGKQLNPRLSIGANVNFIYSQLETYNSIGASIDLSGTFRNEEKGFLVTALVKNVGYQFKRYTNQERGSLPVNFQLAAAYKLPHAPFRLSILAHHLNRWDLTYNDPTLQPTIDPLTGETIPVPKAGFLEKLARHFTYQIEIIASKRLHLRTGFDYQRRKELALSQRPGIAGFSFGLGLNFRRFSLDYGFMVYSRAGFNNILTLRSNLDDWRK